MQGISVGDPVLLSYTYCASCRSCEAQHLSYCEQFIPLNFFGRPTFKDGKGKEIPGSFFGQSSFASWSVVKGSSAVNVKGIVQDKKELALFAPLGCGVQTGSGTVVNAAGAGEKDVVVVTGLGGVGLSAIMGAKIVGARIIVGIDRVKKRLDLAKELGATHVIDSSSLEEGKTLSDVVKEICDGVGPTGMLCFTSISLVFEGMVLTSYSRCRDDGRTSPDQSLHRLHQDQGSSLASWLCADRLSARAQCFRLHAYRQDVPRCHRGRVVCA